MIGGGGGGGGGEQYQQRPPEHNFSPSGTGGALHDDVFAKIERLGALRDKGIISEQEFHQKKGELLARL
jgi:hypothetical protein